MLICEDPASDLATPTGPMRTYLIRPSATGKFPGIVLFSEIFQVTQPVRRIAATLAGHGYVVAIPEIFHELVEGPGVVISYDTAERGNRCKVEKELAAYDADARAVVDHLRRHPNCTGRLGSFGICIGGHLALRCAMNREVSAAACFYATDIHKRSLGKGMNDNTLDRLGEVAGELLMIWGRQDPHIPAEGRRLIYDALTAADVNFTWHEFNAQHAFLRDEGHRFDPQLARLSLGLVLDLFSRRLGEGALPPTAVDQAGC
ncbi:MAG: dienelactone hydrolase family protein [Phycisphaerae bacterium]|nr:dienelactone hydrolase family protein [Phycisphaerae bacterium]MDW8261094.1 dienelactone hydrolase family protein [Phycisphaerales bacterium]